MSQRPRLHRYRWEAIYAVEFTLDRLERRCWGLGAALASRQWSCLVAHDTRFLGAQFATYAYRTMEAQGVRTSFAAAPAPFPAIELALEHRRADCALVVSAGNLPYWYNGLIVLAPSVDAGLIEGGARAPDAAKIDFPPQTLEETPQTQVDLRTPYLDRLRTSVDIDLIRRATMTVFVDPMNGTTSGVVPAIIGEASQTKAIEINRESDPLFGRWPPQPVESGLVRLRKLVRESDSHLGVAVSADGRALGVTDNTGELAPPLEVTLLLANYLSQHYRQRGAVVVPRVADETMLRSWERVTGLKVEAADEPAARMAEILGNDRNGLLAGTTANGEVTLGRYSASPDAIMAALLLIEVTARAGGMLRTLIDEQRGWMSP